MPRYTATIRFDAPDFQSARAFARDIRTVVRDDVGSFAYREANVKLLKLRDPDAEQSATDQS